ncbi:MAG: Coenzyme F420 hydrogenase/dehydrogenase, beta subunit C-terminal domain [Bacillota bacterium]|nr:Coenzyme F420 hydrogenase/dehydrogenase, beta subunit C-terminal domain [Bacillota bacterium]
MGIGASSKRLQQEVIEQNLCTSCGNCIGICPYIKTYKERTAFIHPCQLDEGNCYKVCPRGETDWAALEEKVFGKQRNDHVLGNIQQLLYARATDRAISTSGQYGGTTSALISYALEKNKIQGAILTGGKPGMLPEAIIATSKGEVLTAAGSKYSAAPTLAKLHEAAKSGLKELGLVGRPCQALAVRKLEHYAEKRADLPVDKVKLVIGLFCFWALSPDFYDYITEKVNREPIVSLDINTENMVIKTTSTDLVLAIDNIRRFIRPACQHCFDPIAEFADISIGSTEFDASYNTLIVRSQQGAQLVQEAVREGILEIKSYPKERVDLLLGAVKNKKLRVLKGLHHTTSYLNLNEAFRDGIEKGGA